MDDVMMLIMMELHAAGITWETCMFFTLVNYKRERLSDYHSV